MLAAHQAQQHARRLLANLHARRAHAGQPRQHLLAAGEVVEPGHRHLGRHFDPQLQRGEQRALREVVVAEEDGVGRLLALHQLREHLATERERRGLGAQPLERGVVQPGLAHARAVAVGALQRARVELRGGEGDAAPPALQQMVRERMAGALLREADAVNAGGRGRLHHMHDRHAAGSDQLSRFIASIEAGDQQAGRAMHQLVAQQLLFLVRVVVGDADQRLVAGRTEGSVHGLEELDEELVAQHREQHGHVRAAAGSQGTRGRVRHIAELRGRILHARDQCMADAALAAQGSRHRDRADASGAGDIVKGDAPAAAGTTGGGGSHGSARNPEGKDGRQRLG